MTAPSVKPPRIESIYPLSPLQEGLLFHSLAAPEAGLYVVQPVFELEGDLDPAALRRAADHVVARHAAMRTAFAWEGHRRPLQVVHREVEVPWEERDLGMLGREEARAALESFLTEDRRRRLDPAHAPLLRIALLRVEPRRHWLVLSHHHLVLDGWSMPLVTGELLATYEAITAGLAPDLPPAPQFGEYVGWLARCDPAASEAFWREALRGFTAPTPLGADTLGRLADPGLRAPLGRARAILAGPQVASLRRFARRHRLAVNTLCQGGWALLLSRYSGREDVLYGAVVSGRSADLESVEAIVGMFVNTLPVRASTHPAARVLPWLTDLQERFRRTREHEHCSLSQIQGWSDLTAGSPLFESLLAVQNLGPLSPDLHRAGLTLRPLTMEERVGLPLTVVAYPAGDDAVYLGAEYDAGRFEPGAVQRLLRHYANLLGALAGNPEARLRDLPLLAPDERRRLVGRWEPAPAASLPGLAARWARERPNAPAVTGEGQLTYADLDRRSALLAARLRAAGAGPERPVGLLAGPGPERVVAALAVLRSGAACLPLRPGRPAEAMAELEAAGAGLLVVDQGPVGPFPEAGLKVIAAGDEGGVAAAPPPPDPAATAWILSTGGSSGSARRAGLSGAALAAAASGLAAALGLGPDDAVLSRSPLETADGLLELILPLAAGAPAAPALGRSAVALGPPSAWEAATGSPGLIAVVTGEPVPAALAGALRARCRDVRSLYGLAEAPACCLGRPGEQSGSGGAPPAGVRVYILDHDLQPLPPGLTGDVWVAGEGVATGYLGAPVATAERFRPDPFAGHGAAMLRTGDRGRRRADGRLELLGPAAADPEVAELLSGHPDVRRAWAGPGGRWVAQAEPGRRPTPAQLRSHLRRRLPAHRVPSSLAVAEQPPLREDGRVDRRRLDEATMPLPDPDGADDLLHRLAQAPRARRDRFLERLRAELGEADPGPRPGPRPAGALPLSFQQEQFWVLERLAEDHSAHNLSFSVSPPVSAREDEIRTALDALVARHEALRCAFREVDGRPVLEVAAAARVGLAATDLAGLPAERAAPEAARLAAEAARRPFDLARPPLLRAHLLSLGGERRLLVQVPHLVADPRSGHVLARDLLALLDAAAGGREPELPPLPLQYPDYALWQRRRLQGPLLESLLAFWRRRLDGSTPLEVPCDRPRPGRLGTEGGSVRFELEPELGAALRGLGERAGAGLGAVLLAGFAALLQRWSGQDDLLLGAAVDLRDRPELANVVGDFGNHVVLRLDAGGRPGLEELVRRAGEVWREAMEHAELPFARLVEALAPPREANRAPIFQVAFSFDADAATPDAPPSHVAPAEGETGRHRSRAAATVDSGHVPYELSLAVRQAGGAVHGAISYNQNLYAAETAQRMAACLRQLLAAGARQPSRPADELPLLTAGQEQELRRWADGGRAPWPEATLGELFEARAAAQPEAPAIVEDGRTLTYGELDRRANRLAWRLRGLGLGPEDRVGVLVGRSHRMVVAVLGVLKAGAAYVPLDPDHPVSRLAYVLDDSGARLAVTEAALVERLSGAPCPALAVDADGLDREPDSPPEPVARPRNLAYVLYTSGSTGRPRGVLVEHRSAVNFATRIAAAYGVDTGDRVLAVAPLTFDLSVFELFTALLAGASLHLAGEADRLQPDRLQRLLAQQRVTVAELPPALMPLLQPELLPGLRLVSVGGEPFSGELVNRWWTPRRRFVNGYGPTEATVAVTLAECEGRWDRMPPIGRPMPNHRAHVLDAGLRPVPVGVPGELCIGGVGLARGYLGRPDLTAERFVPDPLAGDPGERLYRTGDRVRWLPSGELEFLGRMDRQVKVRGHRVEPGEVESVIFRQPGVRQAAVEALDEAGGGRQLVAYLAGDWRPDLPELRERLAAELPSYMLPSRVVHLDRLPLTARGKVDRRALPPPAEQETEVAAQPRTWVEERVALEVFGPLLQLPQVDVERDFFELGGNSLEAIQVVSRARDTFGVEVGLAEFLAEPTVRRLAALVERASAAQAETGDLLEQIVAEVEALSDEEAERLLSSLEAGGG